MRPRGSTSTSNRSYASPKVYRTCTIEVGRLLRSPFTGSRFLACADLYELLAYNPTISARASERGGAGRLGEPSRSYAPPPPFLLRCTAASWSSRGLLAAAHSNRIGGGEAAGTIDISCRQRVLEAAKVPRRSHAGANRRQHAGVAMTRRRELWTLVSDAR